MKYENLLIHGNSKKRTGRNFSVGFLFLLAVSVSFSSSFLSSEGKESSIKNSNVPTRVARAKAGDSTENSLNTSYPAVYDSFRTSGITRSSSNMTFSATFSSYGSEPGQEKNFTFGYYEEGSNFLPLYATYDVTTAENVKTERITEFPQISRSLEPFFSGIGSQFGSGNLSFSYTLDLEEDEEIDLDSIVFHNVLMLKDNVASPTLSDPLEKFSLDLNKKAYTNNRGKAIEIKYQKDLFKMNFDSFSTIGSFTSFRFNLDVVGDIDQYKTMNASAYLLNQEKIESGQIYLGYLISALTTTELVVTFGDETVQSLSFRGDSTSINLKNGNNSVVLMTEKIDMGNVVKITLSNISFLINLVSASTKTALANTNGEARFGLISFNIAENGSPMINDINIHLIIEVLAFILVYLGISFGLYFYQKNKYKNDEFRRMNKRKFVKTASLGFVAIGTLLFTLVCVIYRAVLLSTSTTIYNPLDIPIIILGVIAIMMIGYFAKFFANVYKAKKTKKMVDLLKLSDGTDKDDDGTK